MPSGSTFAIAMVTLLMAKYLPGLPSMIAFCPGPLLPHSGATFQTPQKVMLFALLETFAYMCLLLLTPVIPM